MKKLLTTITLSALFGTTASSLKPVFTNTIVSHGFKSNQLNNKDIIVQNQNDTNPFINKIPTFDDNSNISSNVEWQYFLGLFFGRHLFLIFSGSWVV